MRLKLAIIFISLLSFFVTAPLSAARPQVEIKTNMGDIVIELASYRAPGTVKNFLRYVKDRFYDNTVFHRIETDFVIQGGGFDLNYTYKESRAGIRNESDNGLMNQRGTIAMARTDDVHSANSQFYINLSNNGSLDAKYGRLGYTVFGKVLSGMEVVDAIGKVATAEVAGVGATVPVNPVVIQTIRLYDPKQNKQQTNQAQKAAKNEEK